MSLTTESSLQRRSARSWRCCICICPCFRRKVAPSIPQPVDADFMTLGRKGKRVICVVHIDPCVGYVFNGHQNSESLSTFARKMELDEEEDRKEKTSGYLSDSSDHDYWFTKWSKPLRTVRRFQKENLKNNKHSNTVLDSVKNNVSSSSAATAGGVGSDPKDNAQQPAQSTQHGGVVNFAFDESPTDPDATATTATTTTTLQQTRAATETAGKPLLYFIHGAGESAESWKKVMHFFAGRQYEVLALDLLGHGYSHTPQLEKCYTFRKLLADVLAVFDAHVSNGRKAAIIAHGYGCSFAVALSRQRSANVTMLALLGSGGPTPLAPPVTWRREWKLPASLLSCLRSLLPCGLRRNALYGPRGKSCLHDSAAFQSLPSYVRHHLAVGQVWPEGDVAFHRKVAVPTLLVHGLKDRFVSLVEMCEMERTIPRAFLEVIPDSGHDIQSDAPDQLCKMLLKFVEHWQR